LIPGPPDEQENPVQRVGASYVGKKIYNYLMTQPEAPPDGDVPEEARPVDEASVDELNGQVFHDEEGQALGTAHRVSGLSVYVVSNGYGNPAVELERALNDPETRLFWRTTGERIVALVYVPDPSRAPERPSALRADEI
jgi:hypothetical protein